MEGPDFGVACCCSPHKLSFPGVLIPLMLGEKDPPSSLASALMLVLGVNETDDPPAAPTPLIADRGVPGMEIAGDPSSQHIASNPLALH